MNLQLLDSVRILPGSPSLDDMTKEERRRVLATRYLVVGFDGKNIEIQLLNGQAVWMHQDELAKAPLA